MTCGLDSVTGKRSCRERSQFPQKQGDSGNTWPTQPRSATQTSFQPIGRTESRHDSDAYEAFGPHVAKSTAPDGKPYKIGCGTTPYDHEPVRVMRSR